MITRFGDGRTGGVYRLASLAKMICLEGGAGRGGKIMPTIVTSKSFDTDTHIFTHCIGYSIFNYVRENIIYTEHSSLLDDWVFF